MVATVIETVAKNAIPVTLLMAVKENPSGKTDMALLVPETWRM